MSRLKKKEGQSGQATSFITRSRALKMLQLNLVDFRRLCIIKGIYPRDPPNLKKVLKAAPGKGGSDQAFYALKDIKFLSHEPLLEKFRTQKAWLKRLRRWRAKGDHKGRDLDPPTYSLDHVIRERYPTFGDALRDLDDALSMLALFTLVPDIKHGLNSKSFLNDPLSPQINWSDVCSRLLKEWEAWVMATGALTGAFISVRGIYYRARVPISGTFFPITWLVPHDRPLGIDLGSAKAMVDWKVMGTFLELFCTLVKFVNFRLFALLGWHYPLQVIETKDTHSEANKKLPLKTPLLLASSSLPLVKEDSEQALQPTVIEPSSSMPTPTVYRSLFNGMVFWLSRECPVYPLSFLIQCMGGKVGWAETSHGPGSPVPEESDPCITHQVIDRPTLATVYADRIYVQPQWVFDCLNQARVLEWQPYGVGQSLPPHLSPFNKDEFKPVMTKVFIQGQSQIEDEPKATVSLTNEQRALAASLLNKKQRSRYERVLTSKVRNEKRSKRSTARTDN